MPAGTGRRRGGNGTDQDGLLVGTIARLAACYPHPGFTLWGWIVGRDRLTARQLAQIGIDCDARRSLVKADLLLPLGGSRRRSCENAAEFELTPDATALMAFARAARDLGSGTASLEETADSLPKPCRGSSGPTTMPTCVS